MPAVHRTTDFLVKDFTSETATRKIWSTSYEHRRSLLRAYAEWFASLGSTGKTPFQSDRQQNF